MSAQATTDPDDWVNWDKWDEEKRARLALERAEHEGRAALLAQKRARAEAPSANVLKPRGVDMSRVQPFKWAWEDRILVGYLNLLVGDEGVGKGTLLAWLIARLTRGELPGDLHGKPARVLILGDEDGFHGVWVPRLHAAGADLTRVCDLPVGDDGALDVGRDAKKLRALLLADRFDVLIFDQLLDNLGADVDDWRAKSVRGAIAPLRRLISDLNLTVIAALHTNKSDATTFRRRLAGSQAFNALSRSSLLLATHPEDDERRVVLRAKGNYAAPPKAIEFRIAAEPVKLNGHTHKPTIATDVQPSDVTIDDVLGAAPEPQTKAHAARTLLADALADGGWHDATPIRTQLGQAGISKSGIDRAVTDLGVEYRRTEAFPSTTQWRVARGGAVTGVTGATGATVDRSHPTHPTHPSRTLHEERAFCDHCNEYTITSPLDDDDDCMMCSRCWRPPEGSCRCDDPALGDPNYVEGYCTQCTRLLTWQALLKWKLSLAESTLVDDLIVAFDATEIERVAA